MPIPEITRTSSDELINTNYAYDDLGYHGEGRVICVIDSEFDTNHVFFQSDIENAKYKYEDISGLLSNMKNINAQVNNEVNRVYKSEKIPITFDYCDNDSDTYPENTNVIHGTHVAGIAAGKNGTAPDGSKFSGVAPEAQLILLKAGNGSGLSDAAILAALEDSSVIDVDVINMSLGSAYVYNKPIWDKVLSVARGSGITVCVSAGNDERGYDSQTPLTTNIEYSADGAPSKTKDAFSIASAQNTSSWSILGKLTVNGEDISFMNTSGSSTAFDEAFSEKTLNLSYCGYGTEEDFKNIDLTDKIAVVLQGEESFSLRMERARSAGAKGIIYILNDDYLNVELINISGTSGNILPGAIVRNIYKEKLINAQSAVIHRASVVNEPILSGGEISYFSSYGTSEDLYLKPDITAPGGNIYSSYPNNKYAVMSGTSMAAPHMSGISALMNQFLEENYGSSLTGSNKVTLLENMLMSSAKIITQKDGTPYSPRVQGAGLVQVDKAMKTPVVLRGDDDKTKICLYDNLNDTFEFSFDAVNLTDTDVTYDNITLCTMTDGYETQNGKNYVSDTINLKSTTDLPSSVTVPANGTVKITCKVDLDSTQTKENLKIFTNGFYVDGFVTLSQSENSVPNISIPFTGFYGNWLKAPFFDELRTSGEAVTGNFGIISSIGNTAYYAGINLYSSEDNIIASDEYIAVSPNSDGCFDKIYIAPAPLRGLSEVMCTLKDSGGNVLGKKSYSSISKFYGSYYLTPFAEGLEDGEYTIELTGRHIYDKDGSSEQTVSVPFAVDTQAPEIISASTVQKDSSTILEITAKDNHFLSAVIVKGVEDGKETTKAAVIDPEKDTSSDKTTTVSVDITGMDSESVVFEAVDFAQNSKEASLSAYENGIGLLMSYNDIQYGASSTTINGTVVNAKSSMVNCDIILGFYDDSGCLKGLAQKAVSLEPGNTPISFYVPKNLSSASRISAFFWDSLDDMTAIRGRQDF